MAYFYIGMHEQSFDQIRTNITKYFENNTNTKRKNIFINKIIISYCTFDALV